MNFDELRHLLRVGVRSRNGERKVADPGTEAGRERLQDGGERVGAQERRLALGGAEQRRGAIRVFDQAEERQFGLLLLLDRVAAGLFLG